jgi:hypothetical protein
VAHETRHGQPSEDGASPAGPHLAAIVPAIDVNSANYYRAWGSPMAGPPTHLGHAVRT